ncbi:MAG: universal stress protein [Roseinatronobacter sp.]
MYCHLLIPVAYEQGHDAAPSLAVARALAAPGAKVTLLHVMEPAPLFALDYLPEGWRADLQRAIEADLTEVAAGFDKSTVIVTEGAPAQQILDHANLHGADCIIIASHRPGMHSLMLGSTASKVVARAGCAVHVVRRD